MKPKNPRKARKETDYSPLVQQKWNFLNKSALAIPDKACENQYVMQSIHEMEEKSMDERIIDQYELHLVDMIKAKTDMTDNGGKISPRAIPDDFLISFDDVKELSISLNTVREFTKEKHLKNSPKKSPTFLPSLDNKSVAPESTISDLFINTEDDIDEEHPIELSELDKVLLNFRTKSPKKKAEMRESFNSNPTYVDQANHDEKIAKALIKSRAKIARQLAENIKSQIGEVQQQIVKTTIAKKFRSFANENGYRLPTCLAGLPPIAPEKPSVFNSSNNNVNSHGNNSGSCNYGYFKQQDSDVTHGSSGGSSILTPVAPPIAEKNSNRIRPKKGGKSVKPHQQ